MECHFKFIYLISDLSVHGKNAHFLGARLSVVELLFSRCLPGLSPPPSPLCLPYCISA